MAEQDEKMTDDTNGAGLPVRLAVVETQMQNAATKGDVIGLESKIDKVESKLESKIDKLESKIDKLGTELIAKIEQLNTEQVARIEKLETDIACSAAETKLWMVRWFVGLVMTLAVVIARLFGVI